MLSRTISRDSFPMPSAFPSPGKQRRRSANLSVHFATEEGKKKHKDKIRGKAKEEKKGSRSSKKADELAAKMKRVSQRLEQRKRMVDEEAARAKENLHLHFQTTEAILVRALREREEEIVSRVNTAAEDRCRVLIDLRNQAASLSMKLHLAAETDGLDEVIDKAKRCLEAGRKVSKTKHKVELVLEGTLNRRIEHLLRSHGTVISGPL